MKMLFIGGLFPKEKEIEIIGMSKGTVHNAANKLQWNLIDGFININDLDFEVLSALFIGTYPKGYKNLFISKYICLYKEKIRCNFVAFCNLWGYRNISRKNSLIRQTRKFILDQTKNKVIIVYSPHTPFLQAAVFAKHKDPSIHVCMIVPDLPQFMNLNEKTSSIYKILKKKDISLFEKYAKKIDSFVLLTKHMHDLLKIDERPYIVVEGMVDINDSVPGDMVCKNNEIKTVVYTGTLYAKFGVVNLVKAFHEIDNPNAVLKICGRGDSEDLINDYMIKDSRIHFLGQLSNEETVCLQKSATILVNPRQNDEEFTKYSFPSKNMEYLLSGNPVIAYKLDGIPDEYDDYFIYVQDNTTDALKNKINQVLNMPPQERKELGNKAREFVLKNKSNIESSYKIYNFIQENSSESK